MNSFRTVLRPHVRKYYGEASLTSNFKSLGRRVKKKCLKNQKKKIKTTKSLGIQTEQCNSLTEDLLLHVENPIFVVEDEFDADGMDFKEELYEEEMGKSSDCDYNSCASKNKYAIIDVMIPDIQNEEENQERNLENLKEREQLICEKCSQQFKQLYDLEHHKAICHPNKKIKWYRCDECKKKFTEAHRLDSHKSIHNTEYECEICKTLYLTHWDLQHHLKFGHTGEKRYVCSVCEKTYDKLKEVRKHQEIHITRPFTCEECHKCFSDKTLLENHQKLYTKPKQFECDQCEKKFSYINYLNKHMMIHVGKIIVKPDAFK